MPHIDETLKRIAAATTKVDSKNSSNAEPARSVTLPGDPNCPICGGIGFVRQDLPIDHPDFGRLQICSCRAQAIAQMAGSSLYRMSNLEPLRKMTFETFKVIGRTDLGDKQFQNLTNILAECQEYAHSLSGWLFMTGSYGVGKTHLAAAIANFCVSLAVPTLFLTVPDLLDWLRFSYSSSESTLEDRFDEIRNIRLLILDDLGTQNATAWAQEKLYQIINHRYTHRLPTVITTNQRIEELDGRIRSRLEDIELVRQIEISAPDYRTKAPGSDQSRLSTLGQHANRTFSTFNFREPERMEKEKQENLRKVWQAAHDFAENPRGWLVILGDYATGKTHLAAAIGNFRYGSGDDVMFVVVPDLLDHLRATFSPASTVSYDRVFDEIRNAPLLILDDLGTQSATPWAREKLYQIFNHRYNAELPTVITSTGRLDDMDPRISSRMLDRRLCTIYRLEIPPYRPTAPAKVTRARRPKLTE